MGPNEHRYRLRSTADSSELVSLLELVRVDVVYAADRDGRMTLRYEIRHGACFYEPCSRQVSPNDRCCPTGDYGLRLERGEDCPLRVAVDFHSLRSAASLRSAEPTARSRGRRSL